MGSFVHLHNHSMGSLLDGFSTPQEITDRALEIKQDAIAITDHGSMACTLSFYESCVKKGVKPLLGVEMYLTDDIDLKDKSSITYHIILIARNNDGLKKLFAISDIAWNRGFYRKPRIDLKTISSLNDGEADDDIIALSGCIDGLLSQAILNEADEKTVKSIAKMMASTFNRFYIEVQPWNPKELNRALLMVADDLGLPAVVTADAHYAKPEDKAAAEVGLLLSQVSSMKASDRARAENLYLESKKFMNLLDRIDYLWPNRKLRFTKYNNHISSLDELRSYMVQAGIDRDDIYTNTVAIADMCDAHIDTGAKHFPRFSKRIPSEKLLRDIAYEAAEKRGYDEVYMNRLNDEIIIIDRLGFSDYFLVIWDMVHEAKKRGIMVGPGRGSAGGSLLAYTLGITEVDPIKFGLTFWRFLSVDIQYEPRFERTDIQREVIPLGGGEPYDLIERMVESSSRKVADWRWVEDELLALRLLGGAEELIDLYLSGVSYKNSCSSSVAYLIGITDEPPSSPAASINPGRVEPPDIDIDFQDDKKDEIRGYVTERWKNVSSISVYTKFTSRNMVRDISRALAIPLSDVNKVCSQFDEVEVFLKSNDTKWFKSKYPEVSNLVEKFEGRWRQYGIHAAGLVISDVPLVDIVPVESRVQRGSTKRQTYESGRVPCVAFDMDECSKIGLIKIDALSLSTLTAISECLKFIKERRGIDVNLADIPLDDERVFEEFSNGNTVGVFQAEAAPLTKLMRQLGVDAFSDLVLATSLVRPGALTTVGAQCIRRKRGEEPAGSLHPALDDITGETFNLFIYQEQLIEALVKVGGFSWPEADKVRKIIGKKQDPEKFEQYKSKWLENASKVIGVSKAKKLWEDFQKFAGYAFNKAHATAYALLMYRCMWLKVHYPVEYILALFRNEEKREKITTIYFEAKRLGVDVLMPDINLSDINFSYVGDKILWGLSHIKGVGKVAAEHVVEKRPFDSLDDLVEKIDKRKCNSKVIDILKRSGALAFLGEPGDEESMYELLGIIDLSETPVPTTPISDVGDEPAIISCVVKEVKRFGDRVRLSLEDKSGSTVMYVDSTEAVKDGDVLLGITYNNRLVSFTNLDEFIIKLKNGYELNPFERFIMGRPFGEEYSLVEEGHVGKLGSEKALVLPLSVPTFKTKKGEIMAKSVISDGETIEEIIIFPRQYRRVSAWLKPFIPVCVKLERLADGGFTIEDDGLIPAHRYLQLQRMKDGLK